MVSTLDRGIEILPGSGSAALEHTSTGIVIISDVAGGTAEDNKIYKIVNAAQAKEIFGDPTSEDAIANYIEIIQRYGIGSILAAKSATPATVLSSLSSAYSEHGISPDVIVIPKLGLLDNTDAVLQPGLEVAERMGSVILGDYAKDVDVNAVAFVRGNDDGMGVKNKRFIPCFGYTKSKVNPEWAEPLSVHLAGLMGMLDSKYHAGRVPSNQPLKGVDEMLTITQTTGGTPGIPEETTEQPILQVSFVDETSSSERLNDVGVVTLNRRKEGDTDVLVSWGDRNALYPKDQGYKSLIAVVRINDLVLKMAKERSMKFIDMPSTRLTGETLETSISGGLALLAGMGAIASEHSTQFLESESDYAAGRLVVCIEYSPIVNVRKIQLKPTFKFTFTVNKV